MTFSQQQAPLSSSSIEPSWEPPALEPSAQDVFGNAAVQEAIAAGDADAVLALSDLSGASRGQLVSMMELLLDLSWSSAAEEGRMLDLVEQDPGGILGDLRRSGRVGDLFSHVDDDSHQQRLSRLVASIGDPELVERLAEAQQGFLDRSREVVAGIETAATEITLGYAGFNLGLLEGLGEGLRDAVMDVIGLGKLLWSAITLNLDLGAVWDLLQSLDVTEMLGELVARWNAPDVFERWKFRGWVVSYTLSMVLIDGLSLLLTGGAAIAAVAAAKLARFGRIATVLRGVFRPVVEAAQAVARAEPGILDEMGAAAGAERRALSAAEEVAPAVAAAPERTYLGSGAFADAYREGDTVTKEIKDRIGREGNSYDLTPEMKARVGDLTQEFVTDIRKASPELAAIIPEISHASPGKLSMAFVDGIELDKLGADARERALDQAQGRINEAKRAIGLDPVDETGTLPDGWKIMVDDNPANFRFDADGNVTGWLDPIAAWPP